MKESLQQQIDNTFYVINKFANAESDKIIHRRREIQYVFGGGVQKAIRDRVPPARSTIVEFKPASANRLRRFIDNFYRDFQVMVTLTYGDLFPTDGRVVKQHLKNFFERIYRTDWGQTNDLVWWLEFQNRGAPHIHIVTTGFLSKSLVSKSWSEVSGAPIESSTRCEGLRCADRAGAYASKYAAKSDQKEVPEGYVNVGRFWGCRRARATKDMAAIPRVVVAATPARTRVRVRACAGAHVRAKARVCASTDKKQGRHIPSVVVDCANMTTIRAYEHEGGWSFYGSEEEIGRLWRYLQENTVTTGRTAHAYGDSAQRM